MAHIANCMAELEAASSATSAPKPSRQPSSATKPHPSQMFPWKIPEAEPQRKYQLFPKERKLPLLNSSKSVTPDRSGTPIPVAPQADKPSLQSTANALKARLNQHSLVRRRKVSVPELRPTRPVQEFSMDSPTLPGRPPSHERSISAPHDTTLQPEISNSFLRISTDEESMGMPSPAPFRSQPDLRLPGSSRIPQDLTPLVIPKSSLTSRHNRKDSTSHSRSRSETRRGGSATEPPPLRGQMITPKSSGSDLTTPKSSSPSATSCVTATTPPTAPSSRSPSPKQWEEREKETGDFASQIQTKPRSGSESSGIMDRGRPRKRSEKKANTGPMIQRADSKASRSPQRKETKNIPQGFRPSDALEKIQSSELELLKKQAFEQVEKFEILKTSDVEAVSIELRYLDERVEYLRRTYNSLRGGRRELHSRICQYLRSPRTVKFSHESMLSQEESLAELDTSIDDWASKLEQAEDRRNVLRQKLLEHVAALVASPIGQTPSVPLAGQPSDVGSITPPRSPAKDSFTSTRSRSDSPPLHRAQVPSTILEQPLFEEEAELVTSGRDAERPDVESICVYAGDDVFALLADVEKEITEMGNHPNTSGSGRRTPSESEYIEINRNRSYEMLYGIKDRDMDVAPVPPLKNGQEDLLLLPRTAYKG